MIVSLPSPTMGDVQPLAYFKMSLVQFRNPPFIVQKTGRFFGSLAQCILQKPARFFGFLAQCILQKPGRFFGSLAQCIVPKKRLFYSPLAQCIDLMLYLALDIT